MPGPSLRPLFGAIGVIGVDFIGIADDDIAAAVGPALGALPSIADADAAFVVVGPYGEAFDALDHGQLADGAGRAERPDRGVGRRAVELPGVGVRVALDDDLAMQ